MSSPWTRSPQSLDPLSWFTGPLVPLVFGGLSVAFGIAVVIVAEKTPLYWLQWPALSCLLAANALIAILTRTRGREFTGLRAAGPVALGCLSVIVSGFAISQGGVAIELWWAPVGLAFVIGALAPYSSAMRVIIAGALSCVVTAVVILLAFDWTDSFWVPINFVLLGVSTVLVATAAAAVFSYQVVSRILRWASQESEARLSSGVLGETAKLRILREELDAVSERALPLLQRIAATGVILDEDRAVAMMLASALRKELVERANHSWLDRLAPEMRLTVVDNKHRADRMSEPQRAALLGLLRAANDGTDRERTAFVIELRGDVDGSTAVAISLETDLPEGRRVTLLAPYYLRLKTAVEELHWARGDKLRVNFRLPPNE